MRKEKEIKFAVGLLRQRGDSQSLVQAGILEGKRTESWVFNAYVRETPEAKRDEAAFFAARDAARYLAGSITLEELIPDMDFSMITSEDADEEKTITLSQREFKNLLKRIERLERRLGLRSEVNKTKRKDAAEAPEDLISQAEVCRLLGCGKSTIKRWADNGFITGYTKGTRVYYSKKELNNSNIVKEYCASKEENK